MIQEIAGWGIALMLVQGVVGFVMACWLMSKKPWQERCNVIHDIIDKDRERTDELREELREHVNASIVPVSCDECGCLVKEQRAFKGNDVVHTKLNIDERGRLSGPYLKANKTIHTPRYCKRCWQELQNKKSSESNTIYELKSQLSSAHEEIDRIASERNRIRSDMQARIDKLLGMISQLRADGISIPPC